MIRIGVRVYLSVGYFTHDRDGAEIVTRENQAPGMVMTGVISAVRKPIIYQFGSSQERKLDILSGPQRRRLAVLKTYWVDDKAYNDAWRAKRAQMFAKLRGDNPPGGVIILAAAYQHDPSEAVKYFTRLYKQHRTARRLASTSNEKLNHVRRCWHFRPKRRARD